MNATTPLADPMPPLTPAGGWSADEALRPLTIEQRHALLVALLREAMAFYGENGMITIPEAADGECDAVGHFVPAAAMQDGFRRHRAQLPPEVREKLDRPIGDIDLDDCLSDEEVQAIIDGRSVPRPESRLSGAVAETNEPVCHER